MDLCIMISEKFADFGNIVQLSVCCLSFLPDMYLHGHVLVNVGTKISNVFRCLDEIVPNFDGSCVPFCQLLLKAS